MKLRTNNLKKHIRFFLFLVAFVLLVVMGVIKMPALSKARVAYPIGQISVEELDPAKIEVLGQALLIDNLYSHILEYDDSGNIQAGIAKTFYWEKDNLIVEFSNKAQTISGHFINAEDAAVSIRRVLRLGASTHSNLGYLICGKVENFDPFQDCEGVRVQDGRLVLRVKSESLKPFLIQSLASDDFVIVPRGSIDRQSLKIIDYKNTSGPYYIEKAEENTWTLLRNEMHYQLRKSSPKEIILVDSKDASAAFELIINDKVDLIPTWGNVGDAHFAREKRDPSDLIVSKTMDIKLYYLQYSPEALQKFSIEERVYVANKIREQMRAKYPLPLYSTETNQFFLDQSNGNLTVEQRSNVNALMARKNWVDRLNKKVSFYFYKQLSYFNVFREISELKMMEVDFFPFQQKPEDRYDLFLATTDTSFDENLSLLNYNFTQGTFGLTKEEGNIWMEKYMALEDKGERAKMLQELHYNALINGVIFPLFKAPYTSLGRNGYKLPLSPLYASSHFWKIERE